MSTQRRHGAPDRRRGRAHPRGARRDPRLPHLPPGTCKIRGVDMTSEHPPTVQIHGRSSSHFTRLTLIFAHELGVAFELVPIHDMTLVDPAVYAGNPALKLPALRRNGSLVLGAENICRTLAELADT